MARVAKKIILNLPGIGRVESLPGGEFDPGGEFFESIVTESGAVHHSSSDAPSSLQFSVPNLTGMLEAFRGLSDANINVQDELKQSWIIEGGFIIKTPKTSGGTIPLEMQGNPAEPI